MALFITNFQVDRSAYLMDTSQLPDRLREVMAYAPQGRRPKLSLRTFLIGAYIGVEELGSFKVSSTYKVLTHMELDRQRELGVRFVEDGTERVVKIDSLYNLSRSMAQRLAYTPAAAAHWKQDIDEAEMTRRRVGLQDALDAFLEASIEDPGGSWYALDGSGAWSWGRSKYKVEDKLDVRNQEKVYDADLLVPDEVAGEDESPGPEDTDQPDGADAAGETSRKHKSNYDPDAAVGSKTHDFGGRSAFYGYMLDVAARVTGPGEPLRPVVARRAVLSPANADVVDPSLTMIGSLMHTPEGVTDILGDRHYQFKETTRWADPLRARGISQHFDLRSDQQGFRDYNGMRLVAGWAHCPATPDELADIPRPGPGASKAEQDEFERLISRRRAYAMDRHERVNSKGRARYRCPALAGSVGCPLRPGSMDEAKAHGLPIVQNPPDLDKDSPACCTNKSGVASVQDEPMRKLEQPHYWGSPAWKAVYDRRTYVEGVFGSLKNGDTEAVQRGFTKFVGLPMVSLGLTLALASANVRHQRNFWDKHPDLRPDHPLAAEEPVLHGVRTMTAEEVAATDPSDHQPQSDAA